MFLIGRDRADEYLRARESGNPEADGPGASEPPQSADTSAGPLFGSTPGVEAPRAGESPKRGTLAGFHWSGELSPQKWMNFYTKVLSRFATADGMKLTVTVDVTPTGGVPKAKVDETRVALRELGLSEAIRTTESDS